MASSNSDINNHSSSSSSLPFPYPPPAQEPTHTYSPSLETPKAVTFEHGNQKFAVVPAEGLQGYYNLTYVDKETPANDDSPHPPSTAQASSATARNGGATMSEPRVRLTRHHAQLNFGNELRQLLRAFGDANPHPDFPREPLPETVRVLDEIVTDFIIETCHAAAQVASHAGRQKVKVDDFMFVLRRDAIKLGRVQELFQLEKELKEARKAFDQNDDRVGKDANAAKEMAGAKTDDEGAETVVDGGDAAAGKKKKGKGKKKRAAGPDASASESGAAKKRKASSAKSAA